MPAPRRSWKQLTLDDMIAEEMKHTRPPSNLIGRGQTSYGRPGVSGGLIGPNPSGSQTYQGTMGTGAADAQGERVPSTLWPYRWRLGPDGNRYLDKSNSEDEELSTEPDSTTRYPDPDPGSTNPFADPGFYRDFPEPDVSSVDQRVPPPEEMYQLAGLRNKSFGAGAAEEPEGRVPLWLSEAGEDPDNLPLVPSTEGRVPLWASEAGEDPDNLPLVPSNRPRTFKQHIEKGLLGPEGPQQSAGPGRGSIPQTPSAPYSPIETAPLPGLMPEQGNRLDPQRVLKLMEDGQIPAPSAYQQKTPSAPYSPIETAPLPGLMPEQRDSLDPQQVLKLMEDGQIPAPSAYQQTAPAPAAAAPAEAAPPAKNPADAFTGMGWEGIPGGESMTPLQRSQYMQKWKNIQQGESHAQWQFRLGEFERMQQLRRNSSSRGGYVPPLMLPPVGQERPRTPDELRAHAARVREQSRAAEPSTAENQPATPADPASGTQPTQVGTMPPEVAGAVWRTRQQADATGDLAARIAEITAQANEAAGIPQRNNEPPGWEEITSRQQRDRNAQAWARMRDQELQQQYDAARGGTSAYLGARGDVSSPEFLDRIGQERRTRRQAESGGPIMTGMLGRFGPGSPLDATEQQAPVRNDDQQAIADSLDRQGIGYYRREDGKVVGTSKARMERMKALESDNEAERARAEKITRDMEERQRLFGKQMWMTRGINGHARPLTEQEVRELESMDPQERRRMRREGTLGSWLTSTATEPQYWDNVMRDEERQAERRNRQGGMTDSQIRAGRSRERRLDKAVERGILSPSQRDSRLLGELESNLGVQGAKKWIDRFKEDEPAAAAAPADAAPVATGTALGVGQQTPEQWAAARTRWESPGEDDADIHQSHSRIKSFGLDPVGASIDDVVEWAEKTPMSVLRGGMGQIAGTEREQMYFMGSDFIKMMVPQFMGMSTTEQGKMISQSPEIFRLMSDALMLDMNDISAVAGWWTNFEKTMQIRKSKSGMTKPAVRTGPIGPYSRRYPRSPSPIGTP
jgi:hypothetical protein